MAYKLDMDNIVPLYYQITQQLRERIVDGDWLPDSKIPSEAELCKEFNVCRTTIRRALYELQKSGLIYSEQGKGTFVQPSRIGFSLFDFYRLDSNDENENIKFTYYTFKKSIDFLPEELSKKIGIGDDEKVVKIHRVRKVDDKPFSLEAIFLPEKIFPGIIDLNLNDSSLYQIIESQYNIKVLRGIESIEPILLDDYESRYLETKLGVPAIRLERTMFTKNDVPIEFRRTIIRGDRFKLYTEVRL